MIGIYKITNKINGNFYIGQSIDIQRRFTEHKTPHGKMTSIKLAIKKYGKENFKFEVIEECKVEELDAKEIYWIAKLKPQYNRSAGGSGSTSHYVSEQTKEILSTKNKLYWAKLSTEEKEKICKRLTGPPKGHAVSKETKEKLRRCNLGKKQSKETIEKRKATIRRKKECGFVQRNNGHKKKVRCIETNQIYNSIKEAGEYFSVDPSSISGVLTGKYKTCKGKHFVYVV